MNKQERLERAADVNNAIDFVAEQAALEQAAIVDIRASLPPGSADLYHQWDATRDSETTLDYIAVCAAIGAAYDRGAHRYVIYTRDAQKAKDALEAEGYVVAMGLSLVST